MKVTAVDDVSFDVAAGEIFAFLGPNGEGKTTTIKMLTTLLKPSSGRIEIDGLDPATQANETRKRFGIVFQDPSLDGELTAEENMDLTAFSTMFREKERHERTEMLLRLFELWDRRKDYVKTFSGGMKRRLRSRAVFCIRLRYCSSTNRHLGSIRRAGISSGRTLRT